MFWAMLDDPAVLSAVKVAHFDEGVRNAVREATPALKLAYDKATQKYSADYEEVLWAVAAKPTLRRQLSDIYDNSYLPMMLGRNKPTLDKLKFNQRLLQLRGDAHGNILIGRGAGWYEFRENVLRGYVRLRAEQQGVDLGVDHHAAPLLSKVVAK